MRKFLYRFIFPSFTILAVLFTLYFFTAISLLEAEKQDELKKGKLFWEWQTPQGNWQVHYTEHGSGSKHLLLIHGFRAHSFTWRYLIEPLTQAGYHVWTIDLIGYGLSDKPLNAAYDADFFIDQLKSFMDAKQISSAHLIGSSMGGGLALNLTLDYPEKVSSLTLINALGYPLDLPFYLYLTRHLDPLWFSFVSPPVIRIGLKQIVFDPDTVSEEQVLAYSFPYQFPGGTQASLTTLKQFDKQKLVDLSQRYNSLKHPLLIIWGDKDKLIPLTHYERFVKEFPQADCLLIPNCGHIPHEEKPILVTETILEFLGKHIDRSN
ncbi:alpha/beta fold hydrolase [Candidatus Protochlamydia sp. R18]|uniref:alpha/beta fold hydrolase n=1 Tax=Candidatus Protochlamydia sp. R18 TaxID=1353977 RepID=UPI0005AB418E|nr:alpha/beta hydrolase [Candidatus Protochlamydia sp. R18]